MLTCEIVNSVNDTTGGGTRFDVRVEIPGIYSEIISYCAGSNGEDLHLATLDMTRARTYALRVFRSRIAMAAGLPEPTGQREDAETTSRRRRRTKAEILADKAREAAQAPVGVPVIPEVTPDPPAETPAPLSEVAEPVTPPPPPSLPGVPMERKAEHEAVIRNLLIENFGDRWMDRPDVKSAAVMMATHAITNGVLVLDGEGNPHPQIRALFSDMVVRVCQQPA